jgi:hypothetical protein
MPACLRVFMVNRSSGIVCDQAPSSAIPQHSHRPNRAPNRRVIFAASAAGSPAIPITSPDHDGWEGGGGPPPSPPNRMALGSDAKLPGSGRTRILAQPLHLSVLRSTCGTCSATRRAGERSITRRLSHSNISVAASSWWRHRPAWPELDDLHETQIELRHRDRHGSQDCVREFGVTVETAAQARAPYWHAAVGMQLER